MRAWIGPVLAVGALAGCGGVGSIDGGWQGRLELPEAPALAPDVRVSLSRVTLYVQDGRFGLLRLGIFVEGDVAYLPGRAVLTPKRLQSQPLEAAGGGVEWLTQPIDVVRQGDGLILRVKGQPDLLVARTEAKLDLGKR